MGGEGLYRIFGRDVPGKATRGLEHLGFACKVIHLQRFHRGEEKWKLSQVSVFFVHFSFLLDVGRGGPAPRD